MKVYLKYLQVIKQIYKSQSMRDINKVTSIKSFLNIYDQMHELLLPFWQIRALGGVIQNFDDFKSRIQENLATLIVEIVKTNLGNIPGVYGGEGMEFCNYSQYVGRMESISQTKFRLD